MNLHYFPNSIFLNILNVFRCFLTYFGIDIFGGDRSHDFCIQHLSGPAELPHASKRQQRAFVKRGLNFSMSSVMTDVTDL